MKQIHKIRRLIPWLRGLGKRPLAFLYVFIYMPWFMLLERYVSQYYLLECRLDYMIPFCEYFIIPYLFWFAYSAMVFAWFFFRESDRNYWRFCFAMFGGMTLALIIYTVFPNGIQIRPRISPDRNVFCRLTALVYSTDTSTNVFPSLHTYTSVLFVFFLRKTELLKKHRGLRILSPLISGCIVASTVLLKQHCVLDMLAGTVMAYAMYKITYAEEQEEHLIKQQNILLKDKPQNREKKITFRFRH